MVFTDEEKRLVEAFRLLSPEGKIKLLMYLVDVIEDEDDRRPPAF